MIRRQTMNRERVAQLADHIQAKRHVPGSARTITRHLSGVPVVGRHGMAFAMDMGEHVADAQTPHSGGVGYDLLTVGGIAAHAVGLFGSREVDGPTPMGNSLLAVDTYIAARLLGLPRGLGVELCNPSVTERLDAITPSQAAAFLRLLTSYGDRPRPLDLRTIWTAIGVGTC